VGAVHGVGVPERDGRQRVDGVPLGVRRQHGLGLPGDEGEVPDVQEEDGRAAARGLELLEVRHVGDPDLAEQVAAHRVLQALARPHPAAREGPQVALGPAPQERLEALARAEHHRVHDHLGEFSTHRRKAG
jgi:hypothetical protein